MNPLVSVIIPVYNREKTIGRAIESVLNQSYPNIELIVVDDGSSDDSVSVIQSYINGDKVRLIMLSGNSGANVARNVGIKNANGDFIAFQDSDDEWLPNKLQKQMDYMQSNHDSVMFCSHNVILSEGYVKQVPDWRIIKKIENEGLYNVLKCENVVSTQTLIISRSVIEDIGLFDETMPRMQDYEYVIRIVQKYHIGFIEQPLVNVYRQNDSISNNKDAYYRALELLLEKHSNFLNMDKFLTSYITYKRCAENIEEICLAHTKGNCKKEKKFYQQLTLILLDQYNKERHIEQICCKNKMLHLKYKEFAIYGAGSVGRNIFYKLKHKNILPRYFIISQRHLGDETFIESIPVKEIKDVIEKDIEIIVAVSSIKLQEDIVLTLIREGFENFFVYKNIE